MVTMTDARAEAERDVATHVTALHQAAKASITSFARRLHPDLHPLGYAVLRHILQNPEGVRAADVALALGTDKSSMSRQVTFLREIGFVETLPDPLDGRASLLVPSETARERVASLSEGARDDYERLFADWSTGDIERLATLLGRFVESATGSFGVDRVQ